MAREARCPSPIGSGCGKGEECMTVTMYKHNRSAFNGYHPTPSDYSEVTCDREKGGCGWHWRTKAAYVDRLPVGQGAYMFGSRL